MRRYTIEVGGRVRVVDVDELSADRFRVVADGQELEVRLRSAEDVPEAVISPEIVPRASTAAFRPRPESVSALPATAPPPQIAAEPPSTGHEPENEVRAPMPGSIVAVRVQPGDAVERGQVVAELEAMKMVNAIRAPRAATVAEVRVQAGQAVPYGHVLVTFETPS